MLDGEELALLIRLCGDHDVLYCPNCKRSYRLLELGSDFLNGRRFIRCARCGMNTDNGLRAHLISCPRVLAEEAAGRAEVIKKVTRALIDRSRLMIAESDDRTQRTLERFDNPPQERRDGS
jgi:hypothetical protein